MCRCRFFFVLLASALFTTPTMFAVELWLNPSVQVVIPDAELVKISPVGFAASLSAELAGIGKSGLGLEFSLGFNAWSPAVAELQHFTNLDIALGVNWKIALVPELILSPHAALGGTLVNAAVAPSDGAEEGSSVSTLDFLILSGLRTRLSLDKETGVDLVLDLNWRVMAEQTKAYHSFVIGLGMGFRAFEEKEAAPAIVVQNQTTERLEKETTIIQRLDRSPQDLAFEQLMRFDNINVIRNRNLTRVILQDSFVANEPQFKSRMEMQLPAVVNYLLAVPGIKSIEVLGYVADDGETRNDIVLSQARAEQVRAFLVRNLAPQWQAIPATGMGKANPLADNTSEEGRRKNRRLEVVLTLEEK